MFRELDQRDSGPLTVTLEWDPVTGKVRVRCEDRCSPDASFSYSVDPQDARRAFLHPFVLRPDGQDGEHPAIRSDPAPIAPAKGRRRWYRSRTAAESVGQRHDDNWIWQLLASIDAAAGSWWPADEGGAGPEDP